MNDPAGSGPPRSIWTRPERSARGPAPEHSRAEIAAAAVALADAGGLPAVTMRAVAAAVGTAPASLYRYVATRGELLELLADQVNGEISFGGLGPGGPAARLLEVARRMLAVYRRHPWLLAIPPARGLPGPNGLGYLERTLEVLAGVDLPGSAKLEIIGLFTGAVRSFAQLEADQRQAGRDAARWQAELAAYLHQAVAGGRYPNLAAAIAGQPAGGEPEPGEPLFDRAMARIVAGLLPAR